MRQTCDRLLGSCFPHARVPTVCSSTRGLFGAGRTQTQRRGRLVELGRSVLRLTTTGSGRRVAEPGAARHSRSSGSSTAWRDWPHGRGGSHPPQQRGRVATPHYGGLGGHQRRSRLDQVRTLRHSMSLSACSSPVRIAMSASRRVASMLWHERRGRKPLRADPSPGRARRIAALLLFVSMKEDWLSMVVGGGGRPPWCCGWSGAHVSIASSTGGPGEMGGRPRGRKSKRAVRRPDEKRRLPERSWVEGFTVG